MKTNLATASYHPRILSPKYGQTGNVKPLTEKPLSFAVNWPNLDLEVCVVVSSGWGVNSSKKRRPCSFRSLKQTCSDRYTWALREGSLSSQYLFLELDEKYTSKVVEDALQCIKMHVAEVSGTSHSTSTSSTKEYFFKKNSTISNRLCFKN